MQLLYGTANTAKIHHMQEMLGDLDIKIVGLNDIGLPIKEIDESGKSPLENAKIKALAYYKSFKVPVFSCDSGLYIDGLDKESQPGVYIRRVNGKTLNDEEMIEHYAKIALDLGGEVKAKYKNAICLIFDDNKIFEYDGDDIASNFLITSKVNPKRQIGFPLDSISLDQESGKYYIDMDANSADINKNGIAKGFRKFFLSTVIK